MAPTSYPSIRVTYNPPNAKTNISPIFCFNGNLKLDNTGMGKMRIIISVKILKAALKNHRNFLGMQLPPPSQNALTGTQVITAVITVSSP